MSITLWSCVEGDLALPIFFFMMKALPKVKCPPWSQWPISAHKKLDYISNYRIRGVTIYRTLMNLKKIVLSFIYSSCLKFRYDDIMLDIRTLWDFENNVLCVEAI